MKKVEIPTTTLNAIKKMLFSKQGVDLSPIAKDITIGTRNEDLSAINLALVMNGYVPELDTNTRYEASYKSLDEITFVSYSLILDCVTAKRRRIGWFSSESNTIKEAKNSDDAELVTYPYDVWESISTSKVDEENEILNRFKKEAQ